MKEYPSELTVIFFNDLSAGIVATIVAIVKESNVDAWRIKPDIRLASILCSGVFGSLLGNAIVSWAVRLKGPLYAAMFKPLSIAIAVIMGVIFLGETLYVGSAVGSIIMSIGFYTLMWGIAKEEAGKDSEIGNLHSSSTQNTPLLRNHRTQQV